jgi:hypothetical protein
MNSDERVARPVYVATLAPDADETSHGQRKGSLQPTSAT